MKKRRGDSGVVNLAVEEARYLSFYDISSAVAESHKRGETVTRVL